MATKTFKYVSYLWDEAKAAELAGDEVALFIYRSNLLGADLRLTNYGGGNTSVKIKDKDPLTGNQTDVMWIKGSGGDIGTLKKSGCAALYVDRLRALENVYRGIEFEDEMVELFNHCIFDLASKAPSIDTPLHGFLPFAHIDHLHPDAAIAIAAAKDGKQITEELFNGEIGWVGWQRPGFDLGLQLRDCLEEAASRGIKLKGIMLGSHGLFTWGDTSFDSYINTLEVIEKCAEYLEANYGKKAPVFGGQKIESLPEADRKKQASSIAPILRGFCSSYRNMIGHFTDDARVLEFTNSNDLAKLAPLGTSCPDHFLRTKISPLVLELAPNEDLTDVAAIKAKLAPAFEAYRAMYTEYYNTCKRDNSPAMRDPNPVVILYPGVGMFTFSKDKTTARLASEYYVNAVNVMKGAEAVSEYTSLPRQEAFDIEYWLLEEAKLQRMPKPKALSGRIALITGSAGGIGKAIAKKFAEEGACVIINDINQERLDGAKAEFISEFGKDAVSSTLLNVTDATSIALAFDDAALAFGGVDIVVNNAGISISKSIAEHSIEEWDRLYDILVKGQFLVSQVGVAMMRKQNLGGDIVNIVSKNAVVAGPNNPGYGSAKAAQAHLTRLMAAELGGDKIRVNTVNPDAVISDSNIWAGGWAEGRAKAYGITVAELPAYYAKRTLLNEIILPDDIANACFAFVGGLLSKSTGNALNVDGGVAMGFYR
ncbi:MULTISPECIES: bifunctional aldolase/short-chain dehydrogenase [unclassified Arcicella]|uniref:bifunctional aldolase/short-chain dehydrogenase n=1 Tax=unclassified Arcicella TaxID=2644986 RepID=UPI002855DC0B|nr:MULTISPECIES: bifunctional aldolase/short-chain dehydrogenase [unclassified Arcicella]MDR6560499.1 rhamnulose-1-phosphate aldolase/alcohol dehydrogenase [Arcicella sp. BE51]MDR6809895.1 rhamnulose-1-phosphate aldolase/alcohol dehydrogenase [Arcicella sp. BE140]MDR6821244.1 rhamnulose-1-phosphate aldolase/alcohol dehydrogenase [Arcicella sp. BE139]